MNRDTSFSSSFLILTTIVAIVVVAAFPLMTLKRTMMAYVTLHNLGNQDMQQVVVHFEDRPNPVGELAAGAKETLRIGDVEVPSRYGSQLRIDFVDPTGKPVQLVVDYDLDSEFPGFLDVDVKDGKLLSITENTGIR